MRFVRLLAVLLLAAPAWGQTIAYVGAGSVSAARTATCSTVGSGNLTFTSGAAMLVVMAYYYNGSNSPSVVSVADSVGSSYSPLIIKRASNGVYVEIWGTLHLAAGGINKTVTVTQTGSQCPTTTGLSPAVYFVQYSGVVAFGNTTSDSGTAASASLTVATQDTNNWVFAVFADHAIQNFTWTTGTNRVAANQNNSVATVNATVGDVLLASPGNALPAVSMTSTGWAGAAVELRTSSGSPPGSSGWTLAGGATFTPSSPSGLSTLEFGMDMNVRTHPWPNVGHDVEFGVLRLWDSNSVKWDNICPSTCTWTELDAWLDLAESKGKKVIYTIGNSGSNPTFPTDWAKWDSFMNALTQHSASRKAAGHQGIDYYEEWNEPNNSFWNSGAGVTAANLVTGMQHAYAAIKAYDPTALAISPSGCYCLQAPETYTASYLAEAQSRNHPDYPFFDIMGYHSYLGWYATTNKAESVTGKITAMKNTMATYGISTKPLWNTEFSWGGSQTSGGPSCSGQQAGADATYQSNFVARAHVMYLANSTRMTWYGWDFAGTCWGWMWDTTYGVHPAGYAYDRVVDWLRGATNIGALNVNGTVYTLNFTRSNGAQAQVVWNSTTTSSYNVPEQFQGYTYTKIDGTTGTAGATLSIGEGMILLQNQ